MWKNSDGAVVKNYYRQESGTIAHRAVVKNYYRPEGGTTSVSAVLPLALLHIHGKQGWSSICRKGKVVQWKCIRDDSTQTFPKQTPS